ncbi:hypothetical protein DPX16_18246 [Anabarilius grahami]|uniref:ribonuclease H n=1 Tax=Anabarilius grahami TaxID=495550 RepID=A0A3N0YE89_ANAGA|nr:hypothetical protein DPX16_18246 [Anabarilius grahami]
MCNVGVHQGSALLPLLFILCMDTITADLQSPHPWSLLFADDVFLSSETRAVTQRDTQLWKDRLDEYGLRLNIKKTTYPSTNPNKKSTWRVAPKPMAPSASTTKN